MEERKRYIRIDHTVTGCGSENEFSGSDQETGHKLDTEHWISIFVHRASVLRCREACLATNPTTGSFPPIEARPQTRVQRPELKGNKS